MNLVVRLLNRHPVAVSVLILIGAAGGFWAARDFVLHTLQPRQHAARQAKLAAEIGEADAKFRHRQYDPALHSYRFVLDAHAGQLTEREKGRLHHQVGLCLMGLAERKNEKENLTRAIEALAEAIRRRPLAGDPAGYAESQFQLGRAYDALARVAGEPLRYERAIAAYGEALKVRTLEADPPGYAALQILIGNAHRDRFVSGRGQKDEQMSPALSAYAEALRVTSPNEHPETFARTHIERGRAYLKLAEGLFKRTHTRNALADFEQALEVFTVKTHPRDFGRAQKLLGDTYMKMYDEVEVDTGTRAQDSLVRYSWRESAKRAYELAAQFGASRFTPGRDGLGN
jgi:tetratricopeptide (TPR) repeat protein